MNELKSPLAAFILLVADLTTLTTYRGQNAKVDGQPLRSANTNCGRNLSRLALKVQSMNVMWSSLFSQCSDALQSIAGCCEDILALRDIRSHLKIKDLFRSAAFQSSRSFASTKGDNETANLRLDDIISAIPDRWERVEGSKSGNKKSYPPQFQASLSSPLPK